jgi:RNA polymerase sigma-B factor
LEDLVQVGSVGLLKAIDKFDPDRGTHFLAFAVPVIIGEVKNYFRDHGWAVKIPRKLQKQKMIVDKAVESLSQRRGRSPTVPEIAAVTGISVEEVYDTFEVSRFGKPLSLEAEYEKNGNDNTSTFLDYLGSVDPRIDGIADRIDLLNTFDRLSEREKAIIRLRFYSGMSQSETAARLGISQMHVSRLQRNALQKLKLTLGDSESHEFRA